MLKPLASKLAAKPVHEYRLNKMVDRANERLLETHPVIQRRDDSPYKKRVDKIKHDVEQLKHLQRMKAADAALRDNVLVQEEGQAEQPKASALASRENATKGSSTVMVSEQNDEDGSRAAGSPVVHVTRGGSFEASEAAQSPILS